MLARRHGRTVSFDPNLRPALWPSREVMRHTLNALAEGCDWVLPGQAEGDLLVGSTDPEAIATYYQQRGAKQVVVKLGAEGAYYSGEQGSGFVPAFPVAQVIDTVGAGDGFAVGVVSALLEGRAIARRGASRCLDRCPCGSGARRHRGPADAG